MPPDEDAPARRDFHLALVGVVVPFAAFAFSGMLAMKNVVARGADAAQASWTRRLVGLAILDLFVVLSLAAITIGKLPMLGAGAPPSGPRIGVMLDQRDRGEGGEVVSVLPRSPAEEAGVRPGDVLTAIDGKPVRTNADLLTAVAATPPGEERALTVRRGGETLELRVRPAKVQPPASERPPLFAREGPMLDPLGAARGLGVAWALTVGLLAVVVAIGARRRVVSPSPLALWLDFAGVLAAGDLALVATVLLVGRAVGGRSVGGTLLGMVAGSAVLLGIAAAWRARLLRRGALPAAAEGARAPRTVLLGVGYLAAGLPRVGIVLAAAIPLLHLPDVDPGGEIRALVGNGLGPAGTALLAVGAVVLAPIGEETLFRGVLLPWLRRFLSPDAAAWASAWVFAVAHLRYGPHVLVVVLYGLVLAWARLRTGRLRASIALHMIINAVALGVTLLRA